MSSTLAGPEFALPPEQSSSKRYLPWLLAGIGLVAMYVPTYWAAINGIWQTDEIYSWRSPGRLPTNITIRDATPHSEARLDIRPDRQTSCRVGPNTD